MVHLGCARASLKALKGNYGAQLKIHKEVMELSGGYRGASVHADWTGHDGQDVAEPSGDADGLCILKSPRHQRASGAHAQNQPGSSKSTATKLAAPRRLIMSPASPKYESFGIIRLFISVDRRRSFKFAKPLTQPHPNLGPLHRRAVKFKYPT